MVTYFDSKKMEVDSSFAMIIDNEETSCYSDVSSNDTPEDQFMYLIDLAIEYGKIDYINLIDPKSRFSPTAYCVVKYFCYKVTSSRFKDFNPP